jgi:quercetin dioxygenase-like cupin family protein
VIRSGQTIENPLTGERVTFLRTAADTDGESVLVDVGVKPGGAVAAAHVHPYQTERFEVRVGTLEFRLGRRKIVARAGDVVTVEPRRVHSFRNTGEDEARFVAEVSPALSFESFLETMFGLAADGKTNKRGMPNPLRLAVIAKAHFDLVRLPYVPAPLQRAALAVGAALGSAAGCESEYVPAGVPAPAV